MTPANDNTPRWLRRAAAASYLSISVRKFDSLRKQGALPAPSTALGVALFDRLALDDLLTAPSASNDNAANPWDDLFEEAAQVRPPAR